MPGVPNPTEIIILIDQATEYKCETNVLKQTKLPVDETVTLPGSFLFYSLVCSPVRFLVCSIRQGYRTMFQYDSTLYVILSGL